MTINKHSKYLNVLYIQLKLRAVVAITSTVRTSSKFQLHVHFLLHLYILMFFSLHFITSVF
jgi:hypothetical protein